MSRGGFDIDDFRDSYWEPESQREGYNSSREASRGGSSQGAKGTKRALEELREAEAKSDWAHPERKQPEASHSSNSREVGLTAILAERDRTNYADRDTTYSLRRSEIQTLTEVGKFRVINIDELAKFAYAGDRPRLESDLRNLIQQGLLERRGTSILKKKSRPVLTLTKRGQKLIRENNFIPDERAIYSGVVKLKEAEHDSDLYRLYQKVADEIESKGGKILRVQLDYDLKEQLYRKLGRAQANGERETQRLKEAFGNIHVKTLQRYARAGTLPGYRLGGHWYFRASELDAWLRSRINSACHPCRLNQEESDGT